MKHCIWCNKKENETSFIKLAHTIPQSIGGKKICENVCDACNLFFGQHFNGAPSVETALKEGFNITRIKLIDKNEIGKNKKLAKPSSQYFSINIRKEKISLKPSYRLQKSFQEKIGRQFKKGLYKIFLEEIERQKKEGQNSKYDFIREFCRYDLGDYPVFYFERRHGIIAMNKNWVETPELFIDEDKQMKYLVNEPSFFEFELLGHVFGIATSKYWQLSIDNYLRKTSNAKSQFFKNVKVINKFNDLDLTLSILD